MKKNMLIYMRCFLCLCIILIPSCQLPLANHFRDEVFPQDTTAKIALSPVLFSSYGILSVVDIVAINPVRGCSNIPKTSEAIWDWPEDSTTVKYSTLPLKIVAIPVAALGTAIFSEQFLYHDDPTNKNKQN